MSDEPVVTLTPRGNSYQADVMPLNAHFMFRDVQTGGELRADVDVSHNGKRLFRSTSTLTLTGRDKIARTAAEMDSGDGPAWRLATYAAVEAVMEAEEQAGASADLRFADEADAKDSMLIDRLFPDAATVLVAPNGAGKSTIVRAIALSIASGREVIPGCKPAIKGPVLYVAGEDAVTKYHARHIAALCRGLGIDRDSVEFPIRLYNTGGRPLTQIARTIGERAYDCAAILLDSHEALLSRLGQNGGIREQASAYWNSIDQINKPSFTISHPNREDRKNWNASEGAMAGTEVNADRARCMWKLIWQDENEDWMKLRRRRYTIQNTKWSHGAELADVSFAVEHWRDGGGYEVAKFALSGPVTNSSVPRSPGRPPTAFSETAEAYRAGATTPKSLALALNISQETAKKRIQRFRADLEDEPE
jgi:hypothetical protein